MIGVKAKTRLEKQKVLKRSRASSITSLGHAGAYIRGIAKKSIKVSPMPAPPGKPPRSRKGQLKRAILFAVEKVPGRVVIGPTATNVGRIGHTHEFGGTEPPKKRKARKPNWKLVVGGHGPVRKGSKGPEVGKLKTQAQVDRAKRIAQSLPPSLGGPVSKKARTYPPRPFMGPALEVSKARLPKFWANSVRGG